MRLVGARTCRLLAFPVLRLHVRDATHQRRWFALSSDVDDDMGFEQDAFGERFEDDGPVVMEDLSNTQLRRLAPGSRRVRALFKGEGMHDDRRAHLKRLKPTRTEGKPRFRLDHLVVDGSMILRDGTLANLIKEGRAEREDQMQAHRRRLEREKDIRSRTRGIRETERPARVARDERPADTGEAAKTSKGRGKSRQRRAPSEAPRSQQEDDAPGTDECEREASECSDTDAPAVERNGIEDAVSPIRMLRRFGPTRSAQAHVGAANTVFPPRAERDIPVEQLLARVADADSAQSVFAAISGREKTLDTRVVIAALAAVARTSAALRRGQGPSIAGAGSAALLERAGDLVHTLAPRDLLQVLSAVAQLGIAPAWLRDLLACVANNARAFDTRLLVTSLLALSSLRSVDASLAKESAALIAAVRRALRSRSKEVAALSLLQAASLCSALARLGVKDPLVLQPAASALAARIEAGTDRPLNVAAALSAAAAAAQAGPRVLGAVRRWLSTRPLESTDECIALCGALRRTRPALRLPDELADGALRSSPSLSPRHLALLERSFAEASEWDADLASDPGAQVKREI